MRASVRRREQRRRRAAACIRCASNVRQTSSSVTALRYMARSTGLAGRARGDVGDEEVVRAEPAAMDLAVGVERRVEVPAADERVGRLLHEPVRALERPPAADAPQRIGGERGVADEGQARPRGRPADVRQVELAQQLGLARGAAEVRGVRERGDVAHVRALEVVAELGQAVAVRRGEDEAQAVLVGEGVGAVGLHEPHPRAVAGRLHAAPVGPVEEAVVGAHAAPDPGHPRDVRVAAVGGDDEPPAQGAARAVAILDDDSGACRRRRPAARSPCSRTAARRPASRRSCGAGADRGPGA